MVYEDLIRQYNHLPEQKKNALLVYKSRLGRAINALGNDEKEIEDIYYSYKELLEQPQNLFMKMTVFRDVCFDDLDGFKKSLQTIEQEVMDSTNLVIPEDIIVYRLISVEGHLQPYAKSNLISTSESLHECLNFFVKDPEYKSFLYQIHLEKGSKVGICPYAILFNSKTKQLVLTQRKDQHELILLKQNYEFSELPLMEKNEDDLDLSIISVDAKLKQTEVNEKSSKK